MKTARMENWWLEKEHSPFQAPELASFCLVGRVYGHANCYEGELVRTTALTHKRTVGDKTYAVTVSGTHYELGEPEAGYEKAYPGSKERLLKQLKEF